MAREKSRVSVFTEDVVILREISGKLGLSYPDVIETICRDYRRLEALDRPSQFRDLPYGSRPERVPVYAEDAAYVRDFCEFLGLFQAQAVAYIFQGFREWVALDDAIKATVTDEKVAEVEAEIRAKLEIFKSVG